MQGANLERYAQLQKLLDPMGAKLLLAQGDNLQYRLNASPDQLRAQLGLAHLQEAPAEPAQPALDANGQPLPAQPAAPSNVMRFRW